MTISTGIYSKLSGTAGVTTLAGTRIYPDTAPPSAPLPYVIYRMQNHPGTYHMGGVSDLEPVRVQIDSYAASDAGRDALGAAVRTAVDGASGTWDDVTVEFVFVEASLNTHEWVGGGDETPVWRNVLDVVIWARD